MTIVDVAFYLDYALDESYTPKRVSIRSGSTLHDLVEVTAVDFNDPNGWVHVPLAVVDEKGDPCTLRAFFLQICVVSMHQNGRDTHVRQVKVFGPRNSTDIGPAFSSVELSQFSTLR
jgi:anaphase-promoting complex subunit 10